jgi:hypothetical protein
MPRTDRLTDYNALTSKPQAPYNRTTSKLQAFHTHPTTQNKQTND